MKLCLKRALRTFIQTAAGYAVVNIAAVDISTKNAAIGFAVSAIAAGLAAVMNLNDSDTNTNTNTSSPC